MMTSEERKQRRKAQVRKEILAAARKVLKAEGAEALTIRNLAEVLAYSPATLYEYYTSKEEIILALRQQVRQDLLRNLHKLDQEQLSPQNYLIAMCREILRFRLKVDNHCILAFPLSPTVFKELPEEIVELKRMYEVALERLKLDKLRTEGQRERATLTLRAFLEGMTGIALRAEVSPTLAHDMDAFCEETISVLLRGWA